jgi:hypothetical protein
MISLLGGFGLFSPLYHLNRAWRGAWQLPGADCGIMMVPPWRGYGPLSIANTVLCATVDLS